MAAEFGNGRALLFSHAYTFCLNALKKCLCVHRAEKKNRPSTVRAVWYKRQILGFAYMLGRRRRR